MLRAWWPSKGVPKLRPGQVPNSSESACPQTGCREKCRKVLRVPSTVLVSTDHFCGACRSAAVKFSPEIVHESCHGKCREISGEISLLLVPQETKLENAQNFSRQISRRFSRDVLQLQMPNFMAFFILQTFVLDTEAAAFRRPLASHDSNPCPNRIPNRTIQCREVPGSRDVFWAGFSSFQPTPSKFIHFQPNCLKIAESRLTLAEFGLKFWLKAAEPKLSQDQPSSANSASFRHSGWIHNTKWQLPI